MSETPNKHRGEVPLPEAGEGAYLRVTVDTLERLETAYGEDYLDVIIKGMSKCRVKVYQTVVGASINNSKNADVPFGLSFEELELRILNALYYTIHGRSYEEQKKIEEEIMAERMEALSENPRVAAFLSSQQQEKQDIEPA